MRLFMILSFILAIASVAASQPVIPMRGPAAERVEQFKKLRMMEVLNLDEETSIRFFARYNRHQEELRKLNEQRDGLIDDLQQLRKRDAPAADYQKVLRELRNLADPAVEIRGRYFDEIGEILTPKQMAEYLIFERNFLQNLREVVRDMQRNRRGQMR